MGDSSESAATATPDITLEAETGSQPFTPRWGSPPTTPVLSQGDIHIWCVDMDKCSDDEFDRLTQLLSEAEATRSARFRFEGDRRRYVIGRGLLRSLLGRYLDQDPARLHLRYLEHGKPALAQRTESPDLQFNLSHSGGIALYALTRIGPIGVDIEQIVPFDEFDDVAERHFSPQELADLRGAVAADRYGAFYRCWTRKESFIKAIGHGLSWPLQSFSVSLLPGYPARLQSLDGDPRAAIRWSLHDLQPAPGFAAAVAVEGDVSRLDCWYWDGSAASQWSSVE